MKYAIGLIFITILSFTGSSLTQTVPSEDTSIEQQEKDKAPEEYIRHRHDHDREQDYLKNRHSSKDIIVTLPRCKLPVGNCIGGCTSTMTIVVDAGSREYLPKDYVYCSDKLKAEFEK